jgi:hypothetical protein
VTRLGNFSPFGRFFKALGAIFYQENSPKIWRFFEIGQIINFLCTNHFCQPQKIKKRLDFSIFLRKKSAQKVKFCPTFGFSSAKFGHFQKVLGNF